MTQDDKDTILRVLNNVAVAKNQLLSGASEEDIVKSLNMALSWTDWIFKVEHPAYAVKKALKKAVLLKKVRINGTEL
ncbi:hypothetical protein KAR91_35160 [Candidatus Pacearchaeota archaeon]|nr:hypothetical protein [Candidatus Pacearchaeota archaeon]